MHKQSLILIWLLEPKNYTNDEPKVIFDNQYDIYKLVALANTRGIKTILGALYLSPAQIKGTAASVKEQYDKVDMFIFYLTGSNVSLVINKQWIRGSTGSIFILNRKKGKLPSTSKNITFDWFLDYIIISNNRFI